MYKLDFNNLDDNNIDFQSKLFPFFLVLFSFMWLISLIGAIKIVYFFGITLTGSFLIFPLTMLINTLIVDIYGYKGARQAIWCGTIVNLSYIFFIHLVNIMPSSPSWELENEFQTILIPQTRIVFASVFSFWSSAFLNNYLMAKLKNKGQTLFPRIIIASYFSLTIDLLAYFAIGFFGTMPTTLFKQVLFFAYLKKIICEILLLPFIWVVIDKIKHFEGFEVSDVSTDFTPFSLNNVYDFSNYKSIKKGSKN